MSLCAEASQFHKTGMMPEAPLAEEDLRIVAEYRIPGQVLKRVSP